MSSYNYRCTFDLQDCIKKLGLEEGGYVQQEVDKAFLRGVGPYTPEDTGTLIASAPPHTIIGSGEIIWDAEKKARRLYYGEEDWNWSHDGVQEGGLRGPYWAERYFQNGGKQEIEDAARKAVKK